MSTTTKKSLRVSGPSSRYLELIRKFALRPISTAAELRMATEILDQLFGRENVDPGETDYVHVLAGLVEEYENQHLLADDLGSGLDVLRHLMSEHEMKQTDLAAVLGVGASAVSMILSGDRPITADHARKLAAKFAVEAGLFL